MPFRDCPDGCDKYPACSCGAGLGWVRRPNGDIWTGNGKSGTPVLLRVEGMWMVPHWRTAAELAVLARHAAEYEGLLPVADDMIERRGSHGP